MNNAWEWSDHYYDLWQNTAELLRRKGRLENLEIQFWNRNVENDSGAEEMEANGNRAEEMEAELKSLASDCGWGRSSLVTSHLGSGGGSCDRLQNQ